MSMFDEKRYLTGKNGIVSEGDTFHLHGAAISGEVRKPDGSGTIPEASLTVSRSGTEEPITVFTTGAAIVGQIKRMDNADRNAMERAGGMPVRLGTLEAKPGQSAAFILEPASAGDDTSGQTPKTAQDF